jgi:glyoxylase-like metal-dependent hydrolase (beta-lactamase superfamily II)
MEIRFEDNFEDVLTKAAVGQKLGHSALADITGLSIEDVRAVFSGDFDPAKVRLLANALGLHAERVIAMVLDGWSPKKISISGLECVNMPFPEAGFPGASANCFVVFNPRTKDALIFDTGVTAEPILDFVQANDLNVQAVLLTHTHRDHIGGYRAIMEACRGASSYAPELEPYGNAQSVTHGMRMELAGFSVEVRLTNGHARGGVTYVIEGLEREVAMVGDAIFSLSMGGAKQAYELALKNNREQILTLSESTVICPGHGPMTSVGEECVRNPFF